MNIEQTIIINAPIDEVYKAYADIHVWKEVLPDVLDIEIIEDDGVFQEFYMTVSRPKGPETVHSRRICKKNESIELTQPVPPPGVKSMVGLWEFFSKGERTAVKASRNVELLRGSQSDKKFHLEEIKFMNNLKKFLNQNLTCFKKYLEFQQEISVSIVLNNNKNTIYDIFWDIKKWDMYWSKIDTSEVLYDDQVHQEFSMNVWRNDQIENVRTIRYREEEGIRFFSPEPPPQLNYHIGAWLFTEKDDSKNKTIVEAKRSFTLIREPNEELNTYKNRAVVYKENLEKRISKILNSFAEEINYLHSPFL